MKEEKKMDRKYEAVELRLTLMLLPLINNFNEPKCNPLHSHYLTINAYSIIIIVIIYYLLLFYILSPNILSPLFVVRAS